MNEASSQRRLAAILAADVVGYSKLMQIDQSATHLRIKDLGVRIINRHTNDNNGRLVKTMGDGFLMEFSSGSEAFAAAVLIQQEMARQEKNAPENTKIILRIGRTGKYPHFPNRPRQTEEGAIGRANLHRQCGAEKHQGEYGGVAMAAH